MAKVPREVDELLQGIAESLPRILGENMTGIYLYGSLTQRAFDPKRSDIDLLVVLKRRLSDRQFSTLESWHKITAETNAWTSRLEIYFLIPSRLLQASERLDCAQFHDGQLRRCGADGNPLLWINVFESGRTLYGIAPSSLVPPITAEMVLCGLQRELNYLKEALAGSESRDNGAYRAYAVLTLCRILYTLQTGKVVSKPRAARWAAREFPEFAELIAASLIHDGSTRPAGLQLRALRALLMTVEAKLFDPQAVQQMPRLRYNALSRE